MLCAALCGSKICVSITTGCLCKWVLKSNVMQSQSLVCGGQVLTSELFGLQHFASNHAIMHLAPTVGGLLMSALLAGNVYQARGNAHGDRVGTCFGSDCYR